MGIKERQKRTPTLKIRRHKKNNISYLYNGKKNKKKGNHDKNRIKKTTRLKNQAKIKRNRNAQWKRPNLSTKNNIRITIFQPSTHRKIELLTTNQ